MKPIQFKYLLSEKFKLENDEIEKITSFFINKDSLVPYPKLIEIIENFNEKDHIQKIEGNIFLIKSNYILLKKI